MNKEALLKAGFAILCETRANAIFNLGSKDDGTFERGELTISVLISGEIQAMAMLDDWRKDAVYHLVGLFDTTEEAITACEEWFTVETAKRVLNPEIYRKTSPRDSLNDGLNKAVKHVAMMMSRQMGKTMQAAIQSAAAAQAINVKMQTLHVHPATKPKPEPKDPC
jgi:hypothetical protein